MSRDIRSYFLPKAADTSNKSNKNKDTSKKVHKRVYVIESDSDDEPSTPKRAKDCQANSKETKNKADNSFADLKPVNVANAFGTSKVKRSVEKNVVKKNEHFDVNSKKDGGFEDTHSDSDFEATLRQIEEIESAVVKKDPEVKSTVKEHEKNAESKVKRPRSELPNHDKTEKQKSKKTEENPATKKQKEHKQESSSPKKDKKEHRSEVSPREDIGSAKKKQKLEFHHTKDSEHDNITVKPTTKSEKELCDIESEKFKKADECSPNVDPIEKKREHAKNYMKFLQREGPKHLGSKEIPKGKPECLSGLTFVITGVLDSLERDQAADIIKEYGGRVTSTVSKKTNYLIRGDEPGASKVDKAITFGTPVIDEDGLFSLIVERSGSMPDSANVSQPNIDRPKTTTVKKKRSPSPMPIVKSEGKESPSISKSQNINEDGDLWVEKYRPTSSKQVIGQQGDRSAMRKLTIWLKNWYKNHSGSKKLSKPSPWAKDDDGAYFKAALLSGPPGVGKTTMAHVVSKELGFDVVEFNASDTRSKNRLHEEISTLLSSQSLSGCFREGGSRKTSSKHVLLMDEVDGMAGNEDRGGVQELIQLIKNSRVPIICMCNDRNHPKIRSLVNYCFDLRVMKPRVEQIRGAMMSIAFKEGLKISAEAMTDMIVGANQDLRQILNHMSMWTAKNKNLSPEEAKFESEKAKKDIKIGPWEVLKKVFSIEDHKTMSIHDKSDLFFYDYSLSPLFVQENYLSVVPVHAKGNILKTLDCVAKAADSISMGDIVDKAIRSNNAWSLLPVQAIFSSVVPGTYMEGYMRSQINFPSWLGKNSRRNKLDRELQELQVHMRLTTSASKQAINLDYLPFVRDRLFNPLIQEGVSGIPITLKFMHDYNLIREDLESIVELTTWPGDEDPMSRIDSKVKAAMTRAYNKEGFMTPFSVETAVKKKVAATSLDLEDEEDAEVIEEDDEDITHDAMIKAKKRTPAAKTQREEAGSSDASKNKGKGKGKGKKKT